MAIIIINNIVIIIINIIGTPTGHRRDTGRTPRATGPRTGNIWSGRASATGGTFLARPRNCLARTHGTHEHETETDFP
eukprot:6360897-Pyramimonas_sp.AAC.1